MPIRTTKPRYYAFLWTEGFGKYEPHMGDETFGARIGQYYSFPSREARDAWVAEGSGYISSPDYRSPIHSADPKLRVLTRNSWLIATKIVAL